MLDNASTDTRGRVSNAFHEHLKRHRDNLLSLQNDQEHHNVNHNRLVSFQDVRNHFDQRGQLDNDPSSNGSRRNQLPPRRKNNDNEDSTNQNSALETDWEDVFHRARR